ncbi:MAG: UDP-N-acetylmuramate dehydrogenase [Thermodesulfobacteriota bacterium]|nr:UDP-N-acetylmuramate dehydrogenase [Thermodesulfobacteriota bacterium]
MRRLRGVDAAELTSMHCGGRISHIFEPEDIDEVKDLLNTLDDFVILGGGTNTIFCDGQIDIPVIHPGQGFSWIRKEETGVYAGAATPMKKVVAFYTDNALSGMEFMLGIPGTIGGALCMNAGRADTAIMDRVIEIELVDKEGVKRLVPGDLTHEYRNGSIPRGYVITGVFLQMKEDDPQRIKQRIQDVRRERKMQPKGYSSGCIFKNPGETSAGLLIDRSGLKGRGVGDACVSKMHANFIINHGHASCSEITELMGIIKKQVKGRFGVDLVEEVKIIG